MFSGNELKRDNVGGEKSYMQTSSNSVFVSTAHAQVDTKTGKKVC